VRPYKPAWEPDAARAFIEKGSGQHFDPSCVAALHTVWQDVLAIRDEYVD
jgi:putative two-component system response regulator